jgi:hypothetical protein
MLASWNFRYLVRLSCIALALSSAVGCVQSVVSKGPGFGGARIGEQDTEPAASRDQKRIEALSVAHLSEGKTAADDVLRLLGPPDYETDDQRIISYLVEHYQAPGGVEVYDGTKPNGPAYTRVQRKLVIMQFGPDGILRRHKSRRIPEDAIPSEAFRSISERWQRRDRTFARTDSLGPVMDAAAALER